MSVMAGRIGYASPAENWRTIFFFLGDWVDLLSIAEPAAIALQAAWGEKKKKTATVGGWTPRAIWRCAESTVSSSYFS